MKKALFIVSFILIINSLQAQQRNTLLVADFWKQQPTVALVQAEITKGNSPSQLDARAFDATTFAINNDAPLATIKFLVEQKGNGVHKTTHDGRIYLHWAAMRGNVALVEYLIAKGADVNLEDSHGTTPLVFSLSGGAKNIGVYDAFAKAGVNLKQKYKNGANLLLLSIANDKDLSLAEYFVSKGLSLKDADVEGSTAFDYAARGGNIEQLKKLLAKGVKPTNAALLFAAQSGGRGAASAPLSVYQYLVEEVKLTPLFTNKQGENVLHGLVRKPNQEEIVKYFIAKGTDVNKADAEGNTPFMLAATGKELGVLELLLPKVKNINAVNHKGESALTFAVNNGSVAAVAFLLDKGADVKLVDKAGHNLAYSLVENYKAPRALRGPNDKDEFAEKLNLLKAKGLNLSAPQKDGSTLYHAAIGKLDLNLLKKLADLKIEVNAKNKEGLTVLHKAALIARDDEVLKYLLSIGADKTIKTEFGETAYDLAAENGFLTKKNIDLNFLK